MKHYRQINWQIWYKTLKSSYREWLITCSPEVILRVQKTAFQYSLCWYSIPPPVHTLAVTLALFLIIYNAIWQFFDLIVPQGAVRTWYSLGIKYGTETLACHSLVLAICVGHGMTLWAPITPCSSVCPVMRETTSLSLHLFFLMSV